MSQQNKNGIYDLLYFGDDQETALSLMKEIEDAGGSVHKDCDYIHGYRLAVSDLEMTSSEWFDFLEGKGFLGESFNFQLGLQMQSQEVTNWMKQRKAS